MVRTGLGLKQFANRVVTDYQQIKDMGGDLSESQVRGVFIQGLIDDFKPKLLQVEKLHLPFHELITELWDYAQKERIGQATTKQTAAATFLTFVPHPSRGDRPEKKEARAARAVRAAKVVRAIKVPKNGISATT